MSIQKVTINDGGFRWEATVYSHGRHGKKLRRRFEKKIDAINFIEEYKSRKKEMASSNELLKDIEDTTLNQEIDVWLDQKGSEFSEGYFRVINPALKVIRSLYGNFSVAKLNPNTLYDFRKLLSSQGKSVSTQNRYIEIVCRILTFSYSQGRLNSNPTKGYKSIKEPSTEMLIWDESEVETFLTFANKKYPFGSNKRWIFVAYLFSLETCVRARELWGIQVKDIKSDSNSCLISRQLSKHDRRFLPTKGKDSRHVPINKTLREEIHELIKMDNLKPDDTVFRNTAGAPIDHDNFSGRVFDRDIVESGLRKIRFHDLRHTAITLYVKKNIPMPIIQKIAGHKNFKTTMRYIHIVGKDVQIVGENLSLFSGSENKNLAVGHR